MTNTLTKFFLSSFVFISLNIYSQEVAVSPQQLPPAISKYLQTNFPGKSLSSISKEKKMGKTEYEIHLDNGTKLEFNNTSINEIESTEKLPDAVIPKNILAYVKKNYPQNFITEWKLSYTKHKIEMNNGVELEFNKKGQFLRID